MLKFIIEITNGEMVLFYCVKLDIWKSISIDMFFHPVPFRLNEQGWPWQ